MNPVRHRTCRQAFGRFWRNEDSGQALVEFALAVPIQLLLVFGIMQMAFLYISSVVVSYTAYRCARCVVVGEHDNLVVGQFVIHNPSGGLVGYGDEYKGADLIAATMLAPLTGQHLSPTATRPPEVQVPGWGGIRRSDIAAWKSRVHIEEEFDGTGDLAAITAVVEFNQELIFPFVDGLFRLILPRAHGVTEEEIADLDQQYVFGDLDREYTALRYGDVRRDGSSRGAIRVIGGRTHYVITKECTLNATMGWQGD